MPVYLTDYSKDNEHKEHKVTHLKPPEKGKLAPMEEVREFNGLSPRSAVGSPRALVPWALRPPTVDGSFKSPLAMVHSIARRELLLKDEREKIWAERQDSLRQTFNRTMTPRGLTIGPPTLPSASQAAVMLRLAAADKHRKQLPFPEKMPSLAPRLSPRVMLPPPPMLGAPGGRSPRQLSPMRSPRQMTPRSPRTAPGLDPLATRHPSPDATMSAKPELDERAARRAAAEAQYHEDRKGLSKDQLMETELKTGAAAADAQTLEKQRRMVAQAIETKYKLLAKAFREFDIDKSGALSPFELEQAIKHFNFPFAHEHVMQLALECADADGDGEISYAEFVAALKMEDTSASPFLAGKTDKDLQKELKTRDLGQMQKELASQREERRQQRVSEELKATSWADARHQIVAQQLAAKGLSADGGAVQMAARQPSPRMPSPRMASPRHRAAPEPPPPPPRKPSESHGPSRMPEPPAKPKRGGGRNSKVKVRKVEVKEEVKALGMEDKYEVEKAAFFKSNQGAMVDEYTSGGQLADAKTLERERKTIAESIKTKYNLLTNAFRDFDLDKSGKLSLFELELGIRSFNLPFPHEHILQIAKTYADQDDDGEISYAEFAAALSEVEKAHNIGDKLE